MTDQLINAAYLERKANAVLGLRGSGSLAKLSDVQGMIVLESERAEWALPGGEFGYFGRINVGAVAAQNSWAALLNESTSGVIAVVQQIQVNAAAGPIGGADLILSVPPNIPIPGDAGNGSGSSRDLRAPTQAGGARIHFGNSAAALGGLLWFIPFIPAPVNSFIEMPILLGPNSALVVRHPVVNSSMEVAFAWRERPVEGKVEIK